MVAEKPVVSFRASHINQYHLAGYEDRQFATLYGVKGHPRLGDLPKVYTSMIEKIESDEDGIKEIETQNTVYRREI